MVDEVYVQLYTSDNHVTSGITVFIINDLVGITDRLSIKRINFQYIFQFDCTMYTEMFQIQLSRSLQMISSVNFYFYIFLIRTGNDEGLMC